MAEEKRIDVEQESGNKTFTRKEGSNGFFYYITGEKRKKSDSHDGGLAFEMTPTHHGSRGRATNV